MNKKNIKILKIEKIIQNIFIKFKLSSAHSKICSKALINAELVGAPSHGLSRLKMYCDRISKKVINPKAKIKIKKISQSIAHVDGNNSIGFVAADTAIKTAISNAKKLELVWLQLRIVVIMVCPAIMQSKQLKKG